MVTEPIRILLYQKLYVSIVDVLMEEKRGKIEIWHIGNVKRKAAGAKMSRKL